MQLWVNNWSAVLTAEATVSAVQLSVDPAAAAQLVNLTEGNYYLLTLVEQDGTGQEVGWEVVKATAQAAGVLTVERAHEGAARVWPSGTLLQVRLTAGTLARIDAAAAGGGSGGGSAAVGDLLTTRRAMPSEWLPVDGAILAQASYPALAGLLGTRWARPSQSALYQPATTSNLGRSAYGNGVYLSVRVGSNGVLRSTDNGATWASVSTSDIGLTSAQDLIFAAGNFWLVGGSGKVAFSADGSAGSWTAVTSGFGTTQINRIIRANGVFVIVGASGKLATSSNGSSWTLVTSQFGTSSISNIAYGNARLVISGASGKVAYSIDDGATWVLASSTGTTLTIDHLVFVGAQFLYAIAAQIYKSADGDVWAAASMPTTSNSWLTGMGADAVLTGADGSNSFATFTTTDGETWTAYTNPFKAAPLRGFAADGTTQVLSSWLGLVARSADSGATWALVTNALGTGNVNAAIQVAGKIIAVGAGGAIGVSTDNGATWQRLASGTTQDCLSIAAGGGLVVVGCAGATLIVSSDNGVTWAAQVITEFAGGQVQAMVFSTDKFVATIGNGGNLIATSPDAVAWSTTAASGISDAKMATGNGRIVILSGVRDARVSTDNGVTWVARQAGVLSAAGLEFDGDVFVAVDSSGYMHVSVDGEQWVRTGQLWSSPKLGAGSGSIAVVGSENTIALSDNGAQWEISNYTLPNDTSVLSKLCCLVTADVIILGMNTGAVMTLARGYDRTTHFALPPAQANTYIKAA